MTWPVYTIGAAALALLTAWLDLRVAGTRVLADRRMPVVGGLIALFMLLSNGWLTSRPIVIYDDRYRALPRLGSIPLEDFLFAFALVVQTLMWWELSKRRAPHPRPPEPPPPPSGSPARRRAG